MTLRTKFFVLAITVSLIPTILGGFIVYGNAKIMLVKSLEDRLQGIATVQKGRVNAYLEDLYMDLRIISAKTFMKSSLDLYNKTGDIKLRNHLIDNLNETKSTNPDIVEISIYDANGRVIVSTDSRKIGTTTQNDHLDAKSYRDSCGFKGVLKDKRPDNAITILCSCPLALDGRQIGRIGVISNADKLISITNDYTGLGQSGETLLAMRDAGGDSLFLVPLRFDKKATLTRKVSRLDTKVAITRALSKEEGFWFSMVDYRGREVIAATRYIDKADWGLVVKIEKAEALSQLVRIRKYIVYGILALIISMFAIASYFTGKIIKPLMELTKAVKKIGKDDSYKITEEPRSDEIGILVSAFNEMAGTLAGNRNTLRKYLVELESGNNRLDRLLEASFEGITITEEGRIIDANKRYAEMYGYELEEILGKPVYGHVAPEYRETVMKHISEGYEKPYEINGLKKDGTVIRVEVCGKNIEYEGRRIRLSALRDITERKATEEQLRESEERFRMIADNITEVFWIADVEISKNFYVSPGYERIWGRPVASVYENPRSFIDAIHEEDRQRVLSTFEIEKTGQPFDHEYRIIRPDGTIRWIWSRGFPVADKTGRVNRYAGVARDVTERKNAEDALRESEEFLNSIVENIPDMIFVKDAKDLRFLRFNKSGETLLGYKREELIGHNDYDFFPKDEADFFTEKDREVINKNQLLDIAEETIVTKHSGTRILHTKKIPVLDSEGNPRYLLGISEDITDKKNVLRELMEAKEAATAANKAKSDFLANMSHELRTPLNSIIGFSEVLEDELPGFLNNLQLKNVKYIHEAGLHLLNLINDILDLAKVESGKSEVKYETLSLKELLDSSIVMHRERALRNGITLGIEMPQNPEIIIEADERKFKQILFNLLSNAVKFTPKGGSVRIAARTIMDVDETEAVEVSVTDTGIGIKPEDMPRLFREFSQLESTYSKKFEGTGLGLALTKSLVELHDGKIWVESVIGEGSRFIFTIPVKQRPPERSKGG